MQYKGHNAPSEKTTIDIRRSIMRLHSHIIESELGRWCIGANGSTYHKGLLREVTQKPPNMIDNWKGMDRKSLIFPLIADALVLP